MNEIQIFNFNNQNVRTVLIDSEVWWIAKDVCDILGLTNPTEVCKRLDDEEKSTLSTIEGNKNTDKNIVNESGLYNIIFQSRKKEAKTFKRWITSEVIPSIRKTGSYSIQPQIIDSEFLFKMAQTMKEKEKQIELMKPKAEFFDTVADSKSAIQIGDVAKLIGDIGRNRLFEILREKKVLMENNIPYQKYCDLGYFRVIEQKYSIDGEVRISLKTLVYQSGIDFIRKILKATCDVNL